MLATESFTGKRSSEGTQHKKRRNIPRKAVFPISKIRLPQKCSSTRYADVTMRPVQETSRIIDNMNPSPPGLKLLKVVM